jgi:hypothetical protein
MIETREVFIFARDVETATKLAKGHGLLGFKWCTELHSITTWGKHDGYNTDTCVFWLGDGYHFHPCYLMMYHIADNFNIEIDDMTLYNINPYLMEPEYTLQ